MIKVCGEMIRGGVCLQDDGEGRREGGRDRRVKWSRVVEDTMMMIHGQIPHQTSNRNTLQNNARDTDCSTIQRDAAAAAHTSHFQQPTTTFFHYPKARRGMDGDERIQPTHRQRHRHRETHKLHCWLAKPKPFLPVRSFHVR